MASTAKAELRRRPTSISLPPPRSQSKFARFPPDRQSPASPPNPKNTIVALLAFSSASSAVSARTAALAAHPKGGRFHVTQSRPARPAVEDPRRALTEPPDHRSRQHDSERRPPDNAA